MSERSARRWRTVLVAAGVLVLAYGAVGLLTTAGSRPLGQLLFLAGVLIAHDALLMPLILLAGALIAWLVPPAARPAVRVAGVVSLAVSLVALPLVLGFGRRADDPSALPLAYGRGLALLLLAIWATALAYLLIRKRLERPARPRRGGRRR